MNTDEEEMDQSYRHRSTNRRENNKSYFKILPIKHISSRRINYNQKNSQELVWQETWTARWGGDDDDPIIGRIDEEIINDNGERLIELFELNGLKITNWIQETRNLKSIIDHIIVNKNSTIKIKIVRVYRSADAIRIFRLLIAKMFLHFINTRKTQ